MYKVGFMYAISIQREERHIVGLEIDNI